MTAETESVNGDTEITIVSSSAYSNASEIQFSLTPGTARQLGRFFMSLADMEDA